MSEDDFSPDPGAHTSHRNPEEIEVIIIPVTPELLEALGQETFGRSREEALAAGTCISCCESALPKCHSVAGVAEYKLSGLCEVCYDALFDEDDE